MHFFCIFIINVLIIIISAATAKGAAVAFVALQYHSSFSLSSRRFAPSPPSSARSNTDDRINTNNDYNTTTIADQTFRAPTPSHLETIAERQVFHTLQPEQVFCTSSHLCRHGHPQAFGFHPTNGPKLVSGLFRLSCPLLCEAIDEYEGEGGVRAMSDWLRSKDIADVKNKNNSGHHHDDDDDEDLYADGGWKRRGYEEANAAQSRIRNELASDDDRVRLASRLGERNADAFMGSGVAGIPPGQTFNVKCVHAHVADHLCRRGGPSSSEVEDGDLRDDDGGGGNLIGRHALQILERRGVPIDGNDVCWQQCNVRHERGPEDWSYLAKKNRSGLRRRGNNSRTRKFRLPDDDSVGK